MSALLYLLGALALLAGLAGVVVPVLPGALLLWGGVWLIAWAGDFGLIGAPTLSVTGVLALLIVAADWAATALELWKDPNLKKALQAGAGTLVGYLVGSVVKVVLAFLLVAATIIGLLV